MSSTLYLRAVDKGDTEEYYSRAKEYDDSYSLYNSASDGLNAYVDKIDRMNKGMDRHVSVNSLCDGSDDA